jgi:hypothetical protein
MRLWQGFFGLLVLASCYSQVAPQSQALNFEPAVVELRGRLVETERYGPPNYGEDPATDAKIRVLVVQLQEPITVRGDTGNTANLETMTGVREIQLLLRPRVVEEYRQLVGRGVLARGTLSRAVTGEHYTAVVMTLLSLREAR